MRGNMGWMMVEMRDTRERKRECEGLEQKRVVGCFESVTRAGELSLGLRSQSRYADEQREGIYIVAGKAAETIAVDNINRGHDSRRTSQNTRTAPSPSAAPHSPSPLPQEPPPCPILLRGDPSHTER